MKIKVRKRVSDYCNQDYGWVKYKESIEEVFMMPEFDSYSDLRLVPYKGSGREKIKMLTGELMVKSIVTGKRDSWGRWCLAHVEEIS